MQFYLITSPNIPDNLWLLTEVLGIDKKVHGKITEDFGQTLKPLGPDLSVVDRVVVPEDTKFAGILWGDGEHFDEYGGDTWGILGELERIGSSEVVIHGVNGEVIADFPVGEDGIPHVIPPEAFGLTRKPWWNNAYDWCKK